MFLEETRHYIRSSALAQLSRVSLEPWQEVALEWTDQDLAVIADRDQRSAQWLTEQMAIAFCTVSAK
ncbi:hypothetical protein [Acaryochloris sp. IP29b_bin.137]|uniref:hypothetical protein n=1 Tax=Acaryochloris sp. IP29b_bin.137 TaxID=2969217 RepID=UPI002619E44F|nr:hypothetical protein [Acaryochloris sp. IP29b_bin.137]